MTDKLFAQHAGQLSHGTPMAPRSTGGVSAAQPQKVLLAPEVHRRLWGEALRSHWPEYLMEGAELGLFMIPACAFVVLLEHPSSPVHQAIDNGTLRRVLIGLAMGLTAIAIIYSPIGQRSGAHFNPAVTFTFYRLGRVEFWDAVFYSVAQFVGGLLGVMVSAWIFGQLVSHPSVQYAVTIPGANGVHVAFLAEVLIAFIQMSMVLRVSNTKPPLGMLLAAELYVRQHTIHQVFCAKLHHHNNARCIFRYRFDELLSTNP